jgi:hypothetical protein
MCERACAHAWCHAVHTSGIGMHKIMHWSHASVCAGALELLHLSHEQICKYSRMHMRTGSGVGSSDQDSSAIVVARPELLFEVSHHPDCAMDENVDWRELKFR